MTKHNIISIIYHLMDTRLAHAVINGDPEFREAHLVLCDGLEATQPECDTSEGRMEMMRGALQKKVVQALLLTAFKEEDGDSDVTPRSLSDRARRLLENPSWTTSVAEFVYAAYGVQNREALHTPMDVIERVALGSAQRITDLLEGKPPPSRRRSRKEGRGV